MQVLIVSESDENATELERLVGANPDLEPRRTQSLDETLGVLERDGIVILDCIGLPRLQEFIDAVRRKHRYQGCVFLVVAEPDAVPEGARELPAEVDIIVRPIDAEAFTRRIDELSRCVGDPVALDVNYVNPFIAATINAVEMLSGMEIARQALFLKRDYKMFGDLSSVMGLSGTATGSLVLSMPEDLAVRLAGRMIRSELTEIDDVVLDAVGELINVISGNAKAAFTDTEYHFQFSLPSVVTGAGHRISHQSGTPCVVVVFAVGDSEMALQICLAPGDLDRVS